MPNAITKGIYVLIIELKRDSAISVGRLGKVPFQKGFYAYVGSAMGGLTQRISRHLRKEKTIHWHIDYLLEKAKVVGVFVCTTNEKLECLFAGKLAEEFESIQGFGASDCNCLSHLFFADDYALKSAVNKAIQAFGTLISISSTTDVSAWRRGTFQ